MAAAIRYGGRVPAAATVTVQRHALSLALLPGVTGRRDVFAEQRAAVLAELRPALETALAPGGTVTVVAPGLLARTTTGASPDLGASGYLASAPATREDGGPALHVTASAAVALLRLAGWTGEITTHEVSAEAGISAHELMEYGGLGAHLLVFAWARPDGMLPVGASAALAAAEQRTHSLYREVVAPSVLPGGRGR